LADGWRYRRTAAQLGQYWDQRFLEDWVALGGRRQTAFFATIVARCLPRLVIEDIAAECLSVFDYGCALGDALPVLQPAFPKSVLSGGDVSSVAIAPARTLHPQFDFAVLDHDWLEETLADVVYCSNTLEHFDDWRERLDVLAATAAQYVIVAVPYCERELISEHVVTFELGTFPESLNNAARLVCLEVIDTAPELESMWPGRQIIAIYAHPPAFDRLIRRGWLAERERGAVEASTALASRVAEDAAKLATVDERAGSVGSRGCRFE
jgi:SAM-dependent methyltransferase